jgi:hypothetical protein
MFITGNDVPVGFRNEVLLFGLLMTRQVWLEF